MQTSLIVTVGEVCEKEQESFDNATQCWICNSAIVDDDKVRDHCHYTGKYRGAAHSKYNLALKKDKTIPVGFHNGTKYDFHLLVRELGRVNGYIRTIARNSEQYISVEKAVRISETTVIDNNGNPKLDKTGKPLIKKDTWYIRLVDTLGFLQASLANCVKTFPRCEFKMLKQEFGDENFHLLIRKGVFPYDWFVSFKNLDEDPKNLTKNVTVHGKTYVNDLSLKRKNQRTTNEQRTNVPNVSTNYPNVSSI